MPNDMTLKFLDADPFDFNHDSMLKSLKKEMKESLKNQIFYQPFTPIKKIKEAKEYTFTSVDLTNSVVTVDKASIWKSMQQMISMEKDLELRRHEMWDNEQRYRRQLPRCKVIDLLRTPDDWCQRKMYSWNGNRMRRCMAYALLEKWNMHDPHFPRGNFIEDVEAVASAIRKRFPDAKQVLSPVAFIAHWNDNPARTFDEVREVLLEANV